MGVERRDEIEINGEPRKPLKVGTVTTVDMRTGKVVEERRNAFTMMPTPPGTCPECAVDHPHDQPHNRDSMAYQYRFYATHGRWPTWTDSMAHCSEDVRRQWTAALIERYQELERPVPEDLIAFKPAGR